MFFFTVCRSFKVLKSKKLHEVLDILAEGLVRKKKCIVYYISTQVVEEMRGDDVFLLFLLTGLSS